MENDGSVFGCVDNDTLWPAEAEALGGGVGCDGGGGQVCKGAEAGGGGLLV